MSDHFNARGALACFAAIALVPYLANGQSASFHALGHIVGANPWDVGSAVSSAGPIVAGGIQSEVTPGWFRPYRWVDGTIELLAGAGGMPRTGFANAISGNGLVIVGDADGAPGPGPYAFRWTATEGMVLLGSLLGGNSASYANGVSSDGAVVVGQTASSSGPQAYRWTSGSGMVGLGDLPGSSFVSGAAAVSSDGLVIVGGGRSALGPEAFRWTETEGMVGLGDLPGGAFSSDARAVSADGLVIVGNAVGSTGARAFRWTTVSGMVDLGDLPGGQGSFGRAVSEDGSIVGGESYANTAFIWNEAHGMRDLQDLLVSVDITGWRLGSVNGIATTTDMVYLVGTGLNPENEPEGFLVTLPKSALMPEPGSLGMLLLAGGGLLRRRVRVSGGG